MKSGGGDKRRFKAMQRRRRLDGELENWRTRPRPVRGSFSSLQGRQAPAEAPSRPWRRAEYFDHQWKGKVQEIGWDVASEFSLIVPKTQRFNPRQVASLSRDQIAVSATAQDVLARLRSRLEGELDELVKAGDLSRRKALRELQRFDMGTSERVAQRMAAEVLAWMRKSVEADLPRFKHIKPGQPPYPRGACPYCDLGGAGRLALIPGEQCDFCGGFPAGEHDE